MPHDFLADEMPGYLDADTLSPDPLDLVRGTPLPGGATGRDIHPARCLHAQPMTPALRRWADALAWDRPTPAVTLTLDHDKRCDILLDFGTEMEGRLELAVNTGPGNLYVSFGESVPEAMTWGLPTTNPLQTFEWIIEQAGTHTRTFDARGFRFVRIQGYDLSRPLTLKRIVSHAWFAFRKRLGEFRCSDRRFQRVWQTAAYTARLCSRTDTYWDGIKRDRGGWFGDARIIQEATDATFHDPAPAAGMLVTLPVDKWTMGVPGFSFDAVAMLRQFVLAHGLEHPCVRESFSRVKQFLEWVRKTQTNRDGFIVRDPKAAFFGNICFVDWSAIPVGGKFEELSWLQCKHVEALRNAAWIAGHLGSRADGKKFTDHAGRLSRKILHAFWRPGEGLIHTLNQTTRKWEWLRILAPIGGERYRKLYFEAKPIGPSKASRHSMALAVWAGLLTTPAQRRAAMRVFTSKKLDPIVTPYFLYYEQAARAECGDPAGAIMAMRDFVGQQLEMHNSSTVWEWYEPWINDLRAVRLGDWPKSLCHGWGGAPVPLAMRYLLGVQPAAPGFSTVKITPPANLPWTFEATIPTPHGPIRVVKPKHGGKTFYGVPKGIEIQNRDFFRV
ncbi:MAG: hypothetical protein K8S99_05990 [Planctomycetes bacterium]|nr:hypothetical protein [Planctomycetota bacterium]